MISKEQKPQLYFRDNVDNTNLPFIPKIRVKPNAIKPLQG
jgi:exosome complex exonuclease RRP6